MKDSLSASEWSILRVLWGHSKLTSGEIHHAILSVKDWQITTVKTLISRMIKKGYLNVDHSDRYPRYSPTMTEEACINIEMQQTLRRIYGSTLLDHTKHFVFYGDADMTYINELKQLTERHYVMISNFLQYHDEKSNLWMIHRTLKNFHSAMGIQNAPSWLRIGENYGMYHIAPRKCFDNLKLEDAVSFILANVIIDRVNHDLPFYFKQGLAVALSTMKLDSTIIDHLALILESITKLKIYDLTVEADRIGEMRQFEMAFLLVDYMLRKYGHSLILSIVRGEIKISSFLFHNQNEFIDDWKKDIEQLYGGGK